MPTKTRGNLKQDHSRIKLSAFNSFNDSLRMKQVEFNEVEKLGLVGTTYGRSATLKIDSENIVLIGVRHTGSFFSWDKWNDYLYQHHPSLNTLIRSGNYT